jgi:hypothetical protein
LAATKQKKLRFSDVAYAIESTPKALRKMLQNPELVLPVPVSDGWTEFSMVQIAVLAIARRLIEFGFSVQSASINSCFIVLESMAVASQSATKNFTAATFLRLVSDSFAIVYFDEGHFKIDMKHGPRWPAVPNGLQARPVLVVPIGAVVKRAFDRALLDSEGDMSGSESSLVDALKHFKMEFEIASNDLLAAVADSSAEDLSK